MIWTFLIPSVTLGILSTITSVYFVNSSDILLEISQCIPLEVKKYSIGLKEISKELRFPKEYQNKFENGISQTIFKEILKKNLKGKLEETPEKLIEKFQKPWL